MSPALRQASVPFAQGRAGLFRRLVAHVQVLRLSIASKHKLDCVPGTRLQLRCRQLLLEAKRAKSVMVELRAGSEQTVRKRRTKNVVSCSESQTELRNPLTGGRVRGRLRA